jgi:hypothetical protein
MVESCGKFTCELEVLGLVFANGDVCCIVEEDVGGLQDRVREEAEFESGFVCWRGVEGGCVRGEGEFALVHVVNMVNKVWNKSNEKRREEKRKSAPSIVSFSTSTPYSQCNSATT